MKLRGWTRNFLGDRHALPFSPMGEWTTSLLEKRAMDIVEFMSDPEVLLKYGLKKPIGLSTAQTWMHVLDYRWTKTPSGQYVDGHEREDIVDYRDGIFLPALAALDPYVRTIINGSFVHGPVPMDHSVRVVMSESHCRMIVPSGALL
ncbi:uncharacterized protein B0H18DRAFT_1073967 [Fomitopsis serialis]|uniref:uncharacterized protein n=1 Tax=Fomitopsis serialis TaxID=139415 RepID=UPI002007F0F2|nr:uncharacterized protein B0H18DRAFT_1073967 [Neoantrodia serialis]KAH9909445.1 hypothetical protein B0H18DRAFT_1073967 [Neoantrodia serialis]